MNASTSVLGIDIGLQGAIAVMDAPNTGGIGLDRIYGLTLNEVHDMPVLLDGPKGRRAINAPLLSDIIYKTHATHAFVEEVHARPGEGAVGAFSFGRARGVVEGVLAAAGIPITFLAPPTWKKELGLGRASKDASRSAVIKMFPTRAELFRRTKDDGRADAILIAIAGQKRRNKNDA